MEDALPCPTSPLQVALVIFFKQEISNLHLSIVTYTRSICLLYAFLNNDLKKDQRESQNWIYRSLLFLPYRQKSHDHPRPILSADQAYCLRGGLNDQWVPWPIPGTALLSLLGTCTGLGEGWLRDTGEGPWVWPAGGRSCPSTLQQSCLRTLPLLSFRRCSGRSECWEVQRGFQD